MSNISIKEDYQLNSILDIYQAVNQTKQTALDYYINHNIIKNGIVLSDKISPINGMHSIKNTYQYDIENNYDEAFSFYPLLTYSYFNTSSEGKNFYKLISAKDIDYENAYLKYATQIHDYHEPIKYYDLELSYDMSYYTGNEISESTYIFDREVSPYINNTYDLLNVVDYLCNRINALNFLMDKIKKEKVVINTVKK